MAQLFRSVPARFLLRLSDAIYAHRGWFLYPQLVLFGVCVFYTVWNLEFLTNRSALVGADKEYHQIFQRYRQEFPVEDDMVVVVEGESPEKNRQFLERLAAKLEAETNLLTGVFYKGDLKLMGRKALLFLPEDSLRDLHQTLGEYLPFLSQFAQATNLVSLFDLVNTQIRTAQREANPQNESLLKAFPALERIVSQASDGLRRTGSPPSPGVTALFGSGGQADRAQYITFDEGRIYLLTVHARSNRLTAEAVDRLRELVDDTKPEVPGLNVGLTGEPILEHDEMAQSQKDTTVATLVSLVLVVLIFIYGYHETGRPLKATGCLIIGLGYTMGYTTLVVGHLNILTITFVPMLIGLAIDFGVHLITRYEEELRHGRSERVALEKAMVNTGMGVFTGAITTAVAFFAMAGTDFDGIQEMGVICGGGMLVCLVPMLTMLPALLIRGQQNVLDHQLGPELETQLAQETAGRVRIEAIWLNRPWAVIGVVSIISLAAALCGRTVRFDYNLLHMQSAGLPAVVFQDKLIQSSKRSVLYAVVLAPTPEEAVRLTTVLTNLPTVETVESMGSYLSGDPSRKLALLRQVRTVASKIQFAPVDALPADITKLIQSLWSLHGYLGLASDELRKEGPPLLSTNDLLEPLELGRILRTSPDPGSRFLWSRLARETRQALADTNVPPSRLGAALAEDLNRVLQIRDWPEKLRSTSRTLSPADADVLAPNLSEAERIRIHRRMLEDAYPQQIARSLDRQLTSLRSAVGTLLTSLRVDDREQVTTKLGQYQRALFTDVHATFAAIQDQDDRQGLQAKDLPEALRNRFIGMTGRLLLQVYPKRDVWDREAQEEFVRQLREQVDPKVTGTPVQLLEYTSLLRNSYQEAALYSLGAIALMVLIHFRRLSCVVLALLPVAVGALWMVGLMEVFDVPFNPANIMTLPLIVGIGVTNGIHILNRFAEELHPSILARSTGKAVIVSGLTTIAGFGSLMLAAHRGIRSLGFIMSIGTATCMIVGLTLLPAILNLLTRRGWTLRKEKNPARQCTIDAGSGGTEV